jgi:hypothetical protein
MSPKDHIKHQITKLYPDLTSPERDEIEITLRNYIRIVRGILQGLSKRDENVLTELANRANVRKSGKRA